MSDNKYLYIIHCVDYSNCNMIDNGVRYGGNEKRMNCYNDHKQYQMQTSDKNNDCYINKIAAGPMESEDGKYMIGSFFIVESTREKAENFIKNDPFSLNNVWEKVSMHRYLSVAGIRKVNAICEVDGDLTTKKMVVVDDN